MSRPDDRTHQGPKVLLLSSFRVRRLSRRVPGRQRTFARDRQSRRLLREASEATVAAHALLSRLAKEAEDCDLSQMFHLLGQMSLMQTAVLNERLTRSRRR